MTYKCLTIAGFDGSGGAGIQADLKTFSALGCYGMTVLTALPVQNTCGVKSCYDIPLSCVEEQLQTIFDDIVPDAIKIGMLFSSSIIELVADFLSRSAHNIPIVLDPVMVAKSGDQLLLPEAVASLKRKMIPISTIITPNLPEGYALAGREMPFEILAEELIFFGSQAVLLKGGHNTGPNADDLFCDQDGKYEYLESKRIASENTHGTGCTLSAAICAYLAKGYSSLEACKLAKKYLYKAMLATQDHKIGKGHGPVHHFHEWWKL